jgi:nicotinamidase-related amidase
VTNALLVVDVQNWGFAGDWPVPDSAALLERIRERVEFARSDGELVVWVQNDGDDDEMDAPGEYFWELTLTPAAGERVWRKTTKDVFESNPDLADWLRENGIDTLDIIGLQSEMCVRSSTLGARDAGFTASPIPGLHGTYPEGTHDETGPTGVSAAELSARVDAELAE